MKVTVVYQSRNGNTKAVAEELVGALSCIAFIIGLYPFDDTPTIWKILIKGIVYYIGVGMIGMGAMVVAFKVISTIGMGLYFGTIYKRTNNLWVPMIMHTLIDLCALPYCFTSNMRYPMISLILLVVIYLGIGCYSVYIMNPKNERHEDGKRG